MLDQELEQLMSRSGDGDLTGEERARLEGAVAQDAEARAVWEEYRRLDGHLAVMGGETDGVDWEAFGSRVRDAVASAEVRRGRVRLWRRVAAVAAMAAVALGALGWLAFRGGGATEPERVVGRVQIAAVSGWERPMRRVVELEVEQSSEGVRVSEVDVAMVQEGAVESGEEDESGEVICSVGGEEPAGTNGKTSTENGGLLQMLLNGST